MKTAYTGSKTEAQLIALIGVGFLLFMSLFNDPTADFFFFHLNCTGQKLIYCIRSNSLTLRPHCVEAFY